MRRTGAAFWSLGVVVVILLARGEFAQAQREKGGQQAAQGAEFGTLEGTVMDEQGRAVQGAQVLVTRKTWPRNRYRQDPFETKTDPAGRYAFPDLYRLGTAMRSWSQSIVRAMLWPRSTT
jgi:hypothetical protein